MTTSSHNESVLDHSFSESYYFQAHECLNASFRIELFVFVPAHWSGYEFFRTSVCTRSNRPLPKSLSCHLSVFRLLPWQVRFLNFSVNTYCVMRVTLLLRVEEPSDMSCCVSIRNWWCTAVCLLLVPSEKKSQFSHVQTAGLLNDYSRGEILENGLINHYDDVRFAHWESACENFLPHILSTY